MAGTRTHIKTLLGVLLALFLFAGSLYTKLAGVFASLLLMAMFVRDTRREAELDRAWIDGYCTCARGAAEGLTPEELLEPCGEVG